jgi:hypothetical protein
MWEVPQLRHSKVYKSANPPNRGVFRASASLERNVGNAAQRALSSLTISSAWRKIRFFRTRALP